MKKTLTIMTAIAALGAGIIGAQAETGFDPNENLGSYSETERSSGTESTKIFRVNNGHNY